MSKSHAILKLFRKLHLYIGIFISPMLLFFAFTGALQTFSLHETTPGSSYKPPAWIVMLAQVHKKQTDIVPVKKVRPQSDALKQSDGAKPGKEEVDAATPKPAPSAPQKSHLPLKIFFLMVSLGLFLSTLTGIYMSFKYSNNKLVITLLLIAGAVTPVLLLPF